MDTNFANFGDPEVMVTQVTVLELANVFLLKVITERFLSAPLVHVSSNSIKVQVFVGNVNLNDLASKVIQRK